jgi:hypothetical protein
MLFLRYGTDRSTYKTGNFSTPKFPNANPRKVFDEATYNLTEILSSVTLETASEKTPLVSLELHLDSTQWATWSKKYNSLYGVCYSLDIHEPMAKLGITEVQ